MGICSGGLPSPVRQLADCSCKACFAFFFVVALRRYVGMPFSEQALKLQFLI